MLRVMPARSRLYLLGAALVATMAAAAAVDGRGDTILFLGIAAAASAIYGLAAWTVLRVAPAARRGLWLCLALGLACRLPLLVVEPTISDDLYRYIWDGRIQRFGHNPYTSTPGDAALQPLHTPVTRKTAHQDLLGIYPPAAQWFFRGVATLGESVPAFKLALLACDLLIVWLLLKWLAVAGHSAWRVLLYAWNPLVIIEVSGSGHIDALAALLLASAFLALSSRRTLLASLAFVAAVEVKFLPIVLAPLFWRRVRPRDVAFACLFGIALAAPFLVSPAGLTLGALPTYLEKWRFNGPVFAAIERVSGGGRLLTLLPAILGASVAGVMRERASSPESWAWPIAAALLAMPCVYPWYLLSFVPFLGAPSTIPLMVWTQTSLLTYYVWHVIAGGGAWQLPAWVLGVEFGGMIAAAWLTARRSHRRDACATE